MKRDNPRLKYRLIPLLLVILVLIWWLTGEADRQPTALPSPQAPQVTPLKKVESNEIVNRQDNAKATQNEPASKVCNLDWLFDYQKRAAAQLANGLGDDFSVFKTQINQAINLTLYHQGTIGDPFVAKLVNQLGVVHNYYLSMLGDGAAQAIDVNIIILGDRTAYEDSTSQSGFDPRMSQGVFFHGSNSAFVEYKGDEITLRTAVHEAVHAINLKLLGRIPRWLNEGLAETFERIAPNQAGNGFHMPHAALAQRPMELYSVIGSETQWGSIDTRYLYFSGWVWVHYLLNNEHTQALKLLLSQEQIQMCHMLNAEQITQILEEAHPTIEQDFNQWRVNKVAQIQETTH
ncbi:hypothetical protein CWB96_16005 [Pseudoalteromonas citrea]|uniref:DUF1570 domain-containing protein n=1 Tax=Pseudoalteromonas citrea TaxID=43655 RepID=A0A5S3XLD5_9GAMM|nr:hypothetical protein [Pseudoalteromonas citrea]TMP38503.1 hypothetical protein CWB97_21880 [Pseudoalteromonas citrea]TMP56011.1 hypothetical protein CWB96_16005 [Pseudoalteromonas citrea]